MKDTDEWLSFLDDEPEILQTCRHCVIAKPLSNFGRDKRGRYGRETRCKPCSKIQHDGCNRAKKLIGPKPEKNSGYKCPICRKSCEFNDWCPDHDRETGRAREWICRGCNTSIGKFKEDPEALQRAIDYIISHKVRIAHDIACENNVNDFCDE